MSSAVVKTVFVYGTLKPGERNYRVAQRGGHHSAEESYVEGFQLFHFEPENYPGIVAGEGIVHGWLLAYDDISHALETLDVLEGTDMDPPLYNRILTVAKPQNTQVWVYVYANNRKCFEVGSTQIESGIWKPQSSEENLYP